MELSTVSNHNLFYWNYHDVDPENPKFQNIQVQYEDKLTFFFSRLHPKNIMHNIHDDALGIFFLLKEYAMHSSSSSTTDSFEAPFGRDHYIHLLDKYKLTDTSRILQLFSDHPIRTMAGMLENDSTTLKCWRDAVVGVSKLGNWYQYGFSIPQGPIESKYVNGLHIREMTDYILNRLQIPKPPSYSNGNAALQNINAVVDWNKIVILSRKSNRLILNEKELASSLSAHFGLESIIISMEEYSFKKQLEILQSTRVLVAMHGSMLIMAMFCRPGTVVIEMFPYAVPSAHYTPYKSMSELPGIDLAYRAWEVIEEFSFLFLRLRIIIHFEV